MLAQPLIPTQSTGEKTDTWFSIIADTENGAAKLFRIAVERLYDVNNWSRSCGISSAAFRLTDEHGSEVTRPLKQGDHFRIDIPGPGALTGNGYDWVQIEKIETHMNPCAEWETVSITIRPAPNPMGDDAYTEHFFSQEATSTFVIQREKKRVTAEVHGRHEKPNTCAGNRTENLPNQTATPAILTTFSAIQWKQLVKGILS